MTLNNSLSRQLLCRMKTVHRAVCIDRQYDVDSTHRDACSSELNVVVYNLWRPYNTSQIQLAGSRPPSTC